MNTNRIMKDIVFRGVVFLMVLSLLFSGTGNKLAMAQTSVPPEEPRITQEDKSQEGSQISGVPDTGSAGIATGNPNGPHSVYAWPFDVVQMGHVIQSYQNYSSGTSAAYFHHGIDMISPNGTDVFTRSGGQVVNVENYTPGSALYWEVAILDSQGYVWQYHHLDNATIPQSIRDAWAAYKANPATGGYVPANTYIGDIVYWTVTSFGYRFNHIHLNILAAGDVYLNPLEFLNPMADTQSPEIQAIGLLNGDTVVSGNTVSGSYGLYVQARDLWKSTVFYLPPYKTEFSLDGGSWTTVWEFKNLPGGANDQTFVNDFFVPGYTKGDYSNRVFYIDLGFTQSGQRAFPTTAGAHTINVRVWDYNGNSTTQSFTWNVVPLYENTTPASIPDAGCASGNGVSKTFNVTDNLLITDVNLGLNISHATRGQIKVTLKSPTDTAATTIINIASDSYDNYDFLVDDASTSAVNDGNNDTVGSPYYDRTVGPSANGSLDAFNGKSSLGVWTVFVCDNTSGTTGTVNRVKLVLQGTANVNTPPVANPVSVTTPEDTAVNVVLSGSDANGNPLTYRLVSSPASGLLSGTVPNLVYTPSLNFYGSDTFSYVVNDGTVDSAPAVVSISVSAVNDLPVANPQSVITDEDLATSITLTGSDVETPSLTYRILTQPQHGVLTGDAPNLTYTPDAEFNGPDAFTFVANDGLADSTAATVSIIVNPVNDTPYAFFLSVGVESNSSADFTLNYGDIDGDALTFEVTSGPASGILSGTAPALTYTPNADFSGQDGFTYTVTDPSGASASESVVIEVSAVNAPPVAYSQDVSTFEDNYFYITLTGTDPEGAELTYQVLSEPTHGEISVDWNEIRYTPDPEFNGLDSLTFLVNDGELDSAPATITITVIPMNDAPWANDQSFTLDEDVVTSFALDYGDADGEALTVTVWQEPAHGTLSGTAPNLTYTPAANYFGPDSFGYSVSDAIPESKAFATVSFTVNSVNDAPVALDQSVSTFEDNYFYITLSGTDVEGAELTYQVLSEPTHGEISVDWNEIRYTPDPEFNGLDSLTFVVSDGEFTSAPATITITVTPMNDAPWANDQDITVNENSHVDFTLDYGDLDGDPLTYAIWQAPAHGTLTGTAPNLTYTPEANYFGTDSFIYSVDDSQPDSSKAFATVSITVNEVTGPAQLFFDDFETSLGWVRNPNNSDTATTGMWERGNPESVYYSGYKQLGTTVSGSNDLVTGRLAGTSAGDYDLDGGMTSMRSPLISLPTGRSIQISLKYYFAHYTNSSTADYLKISIVGTSSRVVFQELGGRDNDSATWATFTGDISDFAGQNVYILIQATDAAAASLVEAGIDDVLISTN